MLTSIKGRFMHYFHGYSIISHRPYKITFWKTVFRERIERKRSSETIAKVPDVRGQMAGKIPTNLPLLLNGFLSKAAKVFFYFFILNFQQSALNVWIAFSYHRIFIFLVYLNIRYTKKSLAEYTKLNINKQKKIIWSYHSVKLFVKIEKNIH